MFGFPIPHEIIDLKAAPYRYFVNEILILEYIHNNQFISRRHGSRAHIMNYSFARAKHELKVLIFQIWNIT